MTSDNTLETHLKTESQSSYYAQRVERAPNSNLTNLKQETRNFLATLTSAFILMNDERERPFTPQKKNGNGTAFISSTNERESNGRSFF